MKKYLLLLPILVLSINTNAQTKFGLKAGLNISNLSSDGNTADSKAGLYAGGYVTININEKFAFQPELLYSAQGAKEEGSLYVDGVGNTFTKVKYKLDYINVPLMFKYYPTQGLSIEAGPQIGFLVSSKFDIDANTGSQTIETSVDSKDVFKSIDFGLNVGLGYELKNGINFGARYNFGLTNISDVEGGEIKNSVFSFGLGYTFK